jgi:glyoxylase-like metal-dependent hydrolase (beta-lactamase superfamily II)
LYEVARRPIIWQRTEWREEAAMRFVIGLALCCCSAWAQQPPAQSLTVHPLKEGAVYWVEGGGGNSTVVIGQNGVIVVDAKTTPDGGRQLVGEIAKLTPKPITHVILTHSDGDHVNGLAGFPDGLTIIAHQGNKSEQDAALKSGGRGAPPANRLPTQVVTKDKETMKIDGVNVTLLHWAPAHTSGDLVVFFPEQKLVATGDIIATQLPDALIHLEKNGSSEGWIKTVKGIVGLNADQFVPGHGNLQTKADIQARLTAVQEKRNKISAMAKEGKSLDEIRQAVGDAPPAAGGGRGPVFASFTQVVYQESTKK